VSYKFAVPGDIAIDISDKRSSIWKKLRAEMGLDVGVRDSKPPLKDTDAVIVRIIHSIPTNLSDYQWKARKLSRCFKRDGLQGQ
jgi:hypothetical protein